MAMGRGNAYQAWSLGLALLCLCVLHHLQVAESATYTVGDSGGWTFNVQDWPKGKSFKAGDVLVFKYQVGQHNVVVVDENGHKNCSPAPNSKVYTSGNDNITLEKGDNFFICGIIGHCAAGMNIAVNAA